MCFNSRAHASIVCHVVLPLHVIGQCLELIETVET
jgi:hypothetical protein